LCASCGTESSLKFRSCGCPTDVLYRNQETALKIERGSEEGKDV